MADTRTPLYEKIKTGLTRKPTEWRLDQIVDEIDSTGVGMVSVAFLDIDSFTALEDEYGFEVSDALLGAIHAHFVELKQTLNGLEHATRYVRDSFLIIFKDMSLEDAFFETENLRRMLSSAPWDVTAQDGTQHAITVQFSGGVSAYPGNAEDRASLVGLAEDAALRAYRDGGNRTVMTRAENMAAKTSHYFPAQLIRLRHLREQMGRSDASLLREALDDLLRKYDQRDIRRRHLYPDAE